jgi:hypothetical protein
MAIEYFGNQTYFGDTNPSSVMLFTNWDTYLNWTCPGSGNMTVKEISVYCKYYAAQGNILLAIYSADRATLICQGTAEVAITSGMSAYDWRGHLTQANITPNPVTLTGGTNYCIVFSMDTANALTIGYSATTNGALNQVVDKTAGYSGALPADWSAGNNVYELRCGVEGAAPSGPSIPILMSAYRRRVL